MRPIAHIRTDFSTKFGVPRQSGLVEELKGVIVFEPEYSQEEAFRGLEGYSHIWLLWDFSANRKKGWSATVKPPRLGGKKRMGVFATRSPFRPNPIGLSSVKLDSIEYHTKQGTVLHVSGADLMDNTPIFDIKPYLPHVDCHADATGGFSSEFKDYGLEVVFPQELLEQLPQEKREAAIGMLKQDPRPGYERKPDQIFKVEFAGFDLRFRVEDTTLTVAEVVKLSGDR